MTPPLVKRYVAGFMFNPRADVVALIEKKRPDWQAGFLNAIGGKMEGDETPDEAMRREFREETGIDCVTWRPLVRLYRRDEWEVFFFYTRTSMVGLVETLTDETVHLCYPAWSSGMLPNLAWLMPMALCPTIHSGQFIDVEDVMDHPGFGAHP